MQTLPTIAGAPTRLPPMAVWARYLALIRAKRRRTNKVERRDSKDEPLERSEFRTTEERSGGMM